MIKRLSVILILILVTAVNCFAYTFSGVVVEISDGCNLKIQRRKKIEKIKLADIECVKGSDLARRAKEKITDIALDKKVTVDVKGGVDKYGSKPAQVTIAGGPDLAYEMLREGYAKFNGGTDLEHPLLTAERYARRNKKGLWHQKEKPSGKTTSLTNKNAKATEKKRETTSKKVISVKEKKQTVKKSFFDHSLSEMATISYDYIKKYVDKFLDFLDKFEKSQTSRKDNK